MLYISKESTELVWFLFRCIEYTEPELRTDSTTDLLPHHLAIADGVTDGHVMYIMTTHRSQATNYRLIPPQSEFVSLLVSFFIGLH